MNMKYKLKSTGYEAISPGTVGVSQRISSSYKIDATSFDGETSGLVFLAENDVMTCGQNQY